MDDDMDDDMDDKDDKDKDDDYACKKKKYELLQAEYEELQNKYSALEVKYNELVEFKAGIDNAKKDELINSFDMISEEDKKELLDKKYLPTFTPNLGKNSSDKKSNNSSSSFKKGSPVKKTKEFKNHYIMTTSNHKVKNFTNIDGI